MVGLIAFDFFVEPFEEEQIVEGKVFAIELFDGGQVRVLITILH